VTIVTPLVLRGCAAKASYNHCEGFGFAWIRIRRVVTNMKSLVLRGYAARAGCDHCEGFGFAWIRC